MFRGLEMIPKKTLRQDPIQLSLPIYLSVIQVDILVGVGPVKLSNPIEHITRETQGDVFIRWVFYTFRRIA